MEQFQPPTIYGDRLMPIISKVIREMEFLELEFVKDERLAYYDDDLADYGRIQNRLKEVYEDLKRDLIRGDTGLERMRMQILQPFGDLMARIAESEKFPETKELYLMLDGGI